MPNTENRRELHNVLAIENEFYNINAVHSDAAAKVDNKLIIKQSKLEGADPNDTDGNGINYSDPDQDGKVFDDHIDENIEFDGQVQKEVCIVPSDGGCFTGPVAIGNLADYNVEKGTENSYIVNLGEIKHQLELLTGHPCWYWDGTKLEAITEGGLEESSTGNTSSPTGEAPGDDQIGVFEAERFQTVSILIGTYDNYCKLIEETNSEIRPEVFLYFCTGENDDGKTFFVRTKKNAEGNLICVRLQLSTSSLKIVSPVDVLEEDKISYTAQEIKDGFNKAKDDTDTLKTGLTDGSLTVKNSTNATCLVDSSVPRQKFEYSNIDEIKTTTSENSTKINTVESTLDDHLKAIQANTANISTNTNAIKANSFKISTNTSNISANSTEINAIKNTLNDHLKVIRANTSAIENNNKLINDNQTESTNRYNYLNKKIDDVKSECNGYANSIAKSEAADAVDKLKTLLSEERRTRKIWLNTRAPKNTDGADGDVWIVYEN